MKNNNYNNSVTGQVVSALSPAGAYAIGQYFKNNDSLNSKDGGNRAGEGSKSHLLAHGLLALAVGSATGQSVETITATTLSTMGAEALTKPLSKYLYGTDKISDLTAEQKQTISNRISLDQVTSAISEGIDKLGDVTINDIQSKVNDSVNSFQLNALQGNFEKIANDIGQSVGSTVTDVGVGAVTGGVGAKVGKEVLQVLSHLNKIEIVGSNQI